VARDTGTKLIAENRRSRHDYELLERVEAGIVLSGTEVKALREGHAQIGQAFADVRNGEMWLIGASISEYAQGNISNHITDRDRKLLLKRSEIDSLYAKVREKGLTLVPTKLYFKDGKVKVEAVCAWAGTFAETPDGLIPWGDRPAEIKRGVVARIPAAFVHLREAAE